MATVYKIEIKTVSAFVDYDPKYLEKIITKVMQDIKDNSTNLIFESTEVNVKRVV